jgi:hypothetical protein
MRIVTGTLQYVLNFNTKGTNVRIEALIRDIKSTHQPFHTSSLSCISKVLCSSVKWHIVFGTSAITTMDESFPFSILGMANGEHLYGLTQLLSENSECDDQQACLGNEFVPGEWDVVSLQWDGVCLLALSYFSL